MFAEVQPQSDASRPVRYHLRAPASVVLYGGRVTFTHVLLDLRKSLTLLASLWEQCLFLHA